MSIIYDALKKVEEKVEGQNLAVSTDAKILQKDKPDFKKLSLYLLVLISGLVAANFLFNILSSRRSVSKDLAQAKPNNVATQKSSGNVAAMVKPAAVSAPDKSPAVVAQPQSQSESQELVVQEPTAPELVLNGVFFSDEGGYALINNRIVKEGDSIEGVKLVKIYADSVEMDNHGSKIKLSSSGR